MHRACQAAKEAAKASLSKAEADWARKLSDAKVGKRLTLSFPQSCYTDPSARVVWTEAVLSRLGG